MQKDLGTDAAERMMEKEQELGKEKDGKLPSISGKMADWVWRHKDIVYDAWAEMGFPGKDFGGTVSFTVPCAAAGDDSPVKNATVRLLTTMTLADVLAPKHGACFESHLVSADYTLVNVGAHFAGENTILHFGNLDYEQVLTEAFAKIKDVYAAHKKDPQTLIFRSIHQIMANCNSYVKPLQEPVQRGTECSDEHRVLYEAQQSAALGAGAGLDSNTPFMSSKKCTEFNWHRFGFYNEIAKKIVQENFGGKFLDIFKLTGLRQEARRHGDCMHFCSPGPLMDINKLMFNLWLS